MVLNCPIPHLWLYRKIRRKAHGRRYISYSNVLEILRRALCQYPKVLHFPILKEMEKYKLIKKIDRKIIEIIGGTADTSLNQYNCPI